MLSMHKRVHSKATHSLRVHQFTTQQVGKGGKRNEFSLNTKSMLSMHKHVHSKATYELRVNQFTMQQAGKGGKRNEFSLNTKSMLSTRKNVHSKGNLRAESAPVHNTASG